MSDLLPPIPLPGSPPPTKPKSANQPLDDFAEGFVGTLLIGSQLLSKSAPHFAEKVLENVLGPEAAAGRRTFRYDLPKPTLLIAPAPLGFVEPHNYGLAPNYLYGFNKTIRYKVPSLGFLELPESSYLHTLPDSHPSVQYEEYLDAAREQRRALEKFTLRATTEQLLQLYGVAKGPEAKKVFFKPDDIINSLEVAVRLRLGYEQGNKLLGDALIPPAAIQALPDPLLQPPAVPSPNTPPLLPSDTGGPQFQTTGELLQAIADKNVPRPKDAPPVSTLQQAVLKLAPDLLRDLITERVDP